MYFPALYFVDIAGRSSARERQTREGREKQAIFERNASNLENGSRYVHSYY